MIDKNKKIVNYIKVHYADPIDNNSKFAKENNARWNIKVISILPLREDETMVILSASLILQGKSLETANLFFQTFKKNSINDWKLVRSYIEAGIPYISTNSLLFN